MKHYVVRNTEELLLKLNRAMESSPNQDHYVSPKILNKIYYAIFSSHLTYGSQIWGQSINITIDKISIIQNNAVRIIQKNAVHIIQKNAVHIIQKNAVHIIQKNAVHIIQKNAVHIITFAEFNAHTDPSLKKLKLLKIKDHLTSQNCLLVYDYINNKLPKSFNNTFIKLKDVHTIPTRNANSGNLMMIKYCMSFIDFI